MYRKASVAIVIPAYNEELLIGKTINTIPGFVDHIIVINDASKDGTLKRLTELSHENKKLTILENDVNQGIGVSLKNGFRYALDHTKSDIIGVMAGDAQCDPSYIHQMLDELLDKDLDYVKATRFFHLDALKAMPAYRKIGNIFISLLTKFSTGYYSISDSQNGYGFFKRRILEKLNFNIIGQRYDYENTLLVSLSISGAIIKDYPVPAIYGDETSSISFFPTAMRALRAIWVGFWRRIYYKYILYSFHPIALFLLSGILLGLFGMVFGLYITCLKFFDNLSPSTGTVMLVALPLFLGFQFVLTAITMDMNNEKGG